jgi:hypothetical protein
MFALVRDKSFVRGLSRKLAQPDVMEAERKGEKERVHTGEGFDALADSGSDHHTQFAFIWLSGPSKRGARDWRKAAVDML